MNEKTIKALRGSIKKWKKIVAGTGEDRGSSNCPLCARFHHRFCVGCPVWSKTGFPSCVNTPYKDYRATRTVKNAKRELAFLRSLLP